MTAPNPQLDPPETATRMAQRDVINALCRAQDRAVTTDNPNLAEAYYEAITVLLVRWKPNSAEIDFQL